MGDINCYWDNSLRILSFTDQIRTFIKECDTCFLALAVPWNGGTSDKSNIEIAAISYPDSFQKGELL